LKVLNLQNDNIQFQAIDQHFTVNCNTVGKNCCFSKVAVLVSAHKTAPPIRCNVDFDSFKGYQKKKKPKPPSMKTKDNQIKSS